MILRLIAFFFLVMTPLSASEEPVQPAHILFLMQTGETARSLKAYQEYCLENEAEDFDLLQQMGLILLDQGYRSRDPEIQLLTLFGAGVSLNEKGLYILEESIGHDSPQMQLVALNFLSRYQNDRADEAIAKAMTSNYLPIRLEASFHLASKKSPGATLKIESLMSKVDEEIHPIFPQLFGIIGDAQALKILRKLLTHPNDLVRIQTILSIANNRRDDLLPPIRRMASHHHLAQQETCAYALGLLRDEASIPKLKTLVNHSAQNVQLAALAALYKLGQKEIRHQIEQLALEGDLFAINLLEGIPESKKVLVGLMNSPNMQIRINAALALLNHREPASLSVLDKILFSNANDLLLIPNESIGRTLTSWKVDLTGSHPLDEKIDKVEASLSIREEILEKTLELPEKDFLKLADAIFSRGINDLVPLLTQLLENLQTPESINLLKKHQQKVGAPLVRNYCNLALYRLKEQGPYEEYLKEWVTKQQNIDLIRFRPLMPREFRNGENHFELTAQETSRLLLEAFESYLASQDDRGISVLISIMQNGNQKNKYALMGMLMRATQ